MQQREAIFQNTEQKCRELNQKFNTLIVKEIERRYNVQLEMDGESEPIIDLLFTDARNDVIELLEKHCYQKPEIIFSLIANLCNHGKYDEGMYVFLLSRFTRFKNYSKRGITHYMDTHLGPISFQKVSEFIDDPKVIELITSGKCVNQCHTVTGIFAPRIEDSKVITSLLPGRYGGEYFHSYIHTDDDLVIDMSNNLITNKQDFDTYFQPKQIITYPSIELEERYESIPEKSTDAQTLQIALEHMKHR